MTLTGIAEIAQIGSFVLYVIVTAWPMLKNGWQGFASRPAISLGLLVIIVASTGYLYYEGKHPGQKASGEVRIDFSDKEIEADIRSKLDQLRYSVRREQPRQNEVFHLSLTHEDVPMDLVLQQSPPRTIAIVATLDMSDIKQYPLKQRQRFILEIKRELLRFGVQVRDTGTAENPSLLNIAHVFFYSNNLNVVDLSEKLFIIKRAVKLVNIQAMLQSMEFPPPPKA